MSSWIEANLGAATRIKQGRYLAKQEMAETYSEASPIPVHGANGIIGWTKQALYNHSVPLITCRGSNCGMVLWGAGPLWVSNNAMAILPSENLDLKFLYYSLLHSPPYEFVSGSAQPQITMGDLSKKIIRFPSLPEQREIAAILGALDDKIELNRKTAATLEEMARALYRSWFVDFDPVRAKAEGREPAFMDAETAALFPDSFGDDGLPIGWKIGVLSDISDLNPEVHSKKIHPAKIEYVDLANTKWGFIEATSEFDWDAAPSRARMVLRRGDTIIGTVRPGNGSYSFIGRDGLTGSTGFAVLRPKVSHNAAFLYLAATAPETIGDLANLADGGAYPAVRPDVVAARPVTISFDMIQRRFNEMTDPLLAKIEAFKNENHSLATLRDTLLPKLMSGELRVGEARDQVEAA